MKSFKDAKGREWKIDINITSARNVLKETGIDLLAIAEGDALLIRKLATKPMFLAEVLWVLCKAQAETESISPEQFGEALAGDPIEHATKALIGALADFFPSGRRNLLREATAKIFEAENLANAQGLEKIKALDVKKELEKAQAELQTTDGETSTALPASSESAPANSGL